MSRRPLVALAALAAIVAVRAAAPADAAEPFTLFETGQVRPLAQSPDGTRLFAVNTPDNRLEVFNVGAGSLSHVVSIPVGLEPIAVAARSNTEVWVVNHLSDSVSIVDVSSPATARVVRTLLVGDEPRDIVFGGAAFDRAFITTAHRGQNTPLHPTIETELATAGIGRADVWVFDAASLGSSLGGNPLTIITLFGDTPRALAVTPSGGTVYAAVFHSGNRTTAINEFNIPNGGEGAGGLPEPNTNFLGNPQPETGLVVKFDGTAWRDELNRSWNSFVMFSLPDKDVFAIDANGSPPAQIAGPAGFFTGVGTILFNMVVNPANGKVYVANLEALNDVRFEGPGTFAASFKPPGEPATVRGHLAESRITVLDGAAVLPRHLNKHVDYTTCCAPLPNAENDDSLAFPLGMAVSTTGELYVAGFGSSEVGVFDTTEIENNTFTPDAADQIAVTGGGPTGLVLDEPRTQLYVLTRFDNSISIVSTATGLETAHVPLHNPEPPSVVAGRPILYDAAFTSSHGDSACASCHIFGDFDSVAWDLGNPDDITLDNPGPFTVGPFGPPTFPNTFVDHSPMKGPMTTQSLRGMANHGSMHWRGDRSEADEVGTQAQPDTGAFNEDVAFKEFNVAFPGLLGRSAQLTTDDMDKFTDFILQVAYPPNPIRNLDNSLTTAQQNGRNFYFGGVSDALFDCNGCHVLDPNGNAAFGVAAPGFFGTDGRFSFENETQHFKIPHLRNMYQKVGMFGMPNAVPFVNPGDNGFKGDQVRGFGFLHDGSFDTLFRFHNASVFNQSGGNPGGFPTGAPGDPQRREMEAFMMAFDSNLAPVVGQQVTRTSTNAAVSDPHIDTLLIPRANAGECDLVVKGHFGGEDQGFVYIGGGQFATDRIAEAPVANLVLRALADTPGQELTYTCVPPGSGLRIGTDRDGDGLLDGDERDAGSDPADPSSPTCTSAGCVACERAIAKEGAKLAQGRSKILAKCERLKVKAVLPPSTDCTVEEAVKLGKLTTKLQERIAKGCGGGDQTCGTADDVDLVATGWAGFCANFEGGSCDMGIADCGDVAACITCVHESAVDQAIDLYYDDLAPSDPFTQAELNLCQQTIGKEAQKFLAKASKARQKCWDLRLKAVHTGACPDGLAAPGTPARKAFDAIATAASKLSANICKRCGGSDATCDGVGDLTPAAIGFSASCPAVSGGALGAPCGNPIATLADIVSCVDCVTDFKVSCMDLLGVPQFTTYAPQCNQ